MLTQFIANAPQGAHAAQSQYLRGRLWEQEKQASRAIPIYRLVSRDYPESPYAGEALFRIGSILHQQSLKGNTNVDNSRRALEVFNELTTLYPIHPKAKEAEAIKGTISGYDIRRSLEVAKFYEKKGQLDSAVFYYNDILARTPSNSALHHTAKAKVNALTER